MTKLIPLHANDNRAGGPMEALRSVEKIFGPLREQIRAEAERSDRSARDIDRAIEELRRGLGIHG